MSSTPLSKVQGVRVLQQESKANTCPLCDCPINRKYTGQRPRVICGDIECVRLYHQLYGIERRLKQGRVPGGQGKRRI